MNNSGELSCPAGAIGNKSFGGGAGIRRGAGDLGEERGAQFGQVLVHIVEVVEMGLLFLYYRFKKLHRGAVAVFPADKDELVVNVHGVVLQDGIEGKDLLHLLPLADLVSRLRFSMID